MRTAEHPTHPIPAANTAQHHRWPSTNELIDLDPVVEPSIKRAVDAAVNPPATPGEATPSSAAPEPPPAPARRPATRIATDPPIPAVGDYYGIDHPPVGYPTPVAVAAPTIGAPHPAPPLHVAAPRTSGLCSAALALAVTSVPLLLLFGVGAILGMLAVVLGIAGVRQVNRDPHVYRGSGRAIGAIIVGTGSTLVGAPFLLLTMGLLALL